MLRLGLVGAPNPPSAQRAALTLIANRRLAVSPRQKNFLASVAHVDDLATARPIRQLWCERLKATHWKFPRLDEFRWPPRWPAQLRRVHPQEVDQDLPPWPRHHCARCQFHEGVDQLRVVQVQFDRGRDERVNQVAPIDPLDIARPIGCALQPSCFRRLRGGERRRSLIPRSSRTGRLQPLKSQWKWRQLRLPIHHAQRDVPTRRSATRAHQSCEFVHDDPPWRRSGSPMWRRGIHQRPNATPWPMIQPQTRRPTMIAQATSIHCCSARHEPMVQRLAYQGARRRGRTACQWRPCERDLLDCEWNPPRFQDRCACPPATFVNLRPARTQ